MQRNGRIQSLPGTIDSLQGGKIPLKQIHPFGAQLPLTGKGQFYLVRHP